MDKGWVRMVWFRNYRQIDLIGAENVYRRMVEDKAVKSK